MFGDFKALLAAHLCLAICPVAMSFVTFDLKMLPILWVLSSIPIAQLMLLSAWVGMTDGKVVRKIAIAAIACVFIAFWQALGEYLMNYEANNLISLSWVYGRHLLTMFAILVILVTIMAGARRFVGSIQLANHTEIPSAASRPQYSLFAMLAVTTTTALVLGLARNSREDISEQFSIAQRLLTVVVFVINILTTIWATLGKANIRRRVAIVFVVSLLLGISMAFGAGSTPTAEHWWLFASMTLIVLVPTTIVAITLLAIRKRGYRLLPPQEPPPA